jgi:hypothetical protein
LILTFSPSFPLFFPTTTTGGRVSSSHTHGNDEGDEEEEEEKEARLEHRERIGKERGEEMKLSSRVIEEWKEDLALTPFDFLGACQGGGREGEREEAI